MLTELTGQMIQLGRSTGHSQLFVDGVLDKECPLVMNGGVHDGNVTKLCLETPTEQRTLTLPDASGTVITSGNREDVTNLPGLQGDNTLVYTGSFRDLRDIVVPPKPRVSCNFECATHNVTLPDGHDAGGCLQLDYSNHMFDVFRVYYLLDTGRDDARDTLPVEQRQKLNFDTPTISASVEVRAALKEFWLGYENHTVFERPRMELVLRFLRMMAEETGIDTSGALHDNMDALIKMQSFGDVFGIENFRVLRRR